MEENKKSTNKNKRLYYPVKFNTKREMQWYIRGLMDAKEDMQQLIMTNINQNREMINYMEFKDDVKNK
ncbi:MAG: hypothetical protein PHU51_06290 [Candidatus Nanoarchaeia archaeon]|nr:hypothetical protein [Candidatus Nanoarchaeia archaeon]